MTQNLPYKKIYKVPLFLLALIHCSALLNRDHERLYREEQKRKSTKISISISTFKWVNLT